VCNGVRNNLWESYQVYRNRVSQKKKVKLARKEINKWKNLLQISKRRRKKRSYFRSYFQVAKRVAVKNAKSHQEGKRCFSLKKEKSASLMLWSMVKTWQLELERVRLLQFKSKVNMRIGHENLVRLKKSTINISKRSIRLLDSKQILKYKQFRLNSNHLKRLKEQSSLRGNYSLEKTLIKSSFQGWFLWKLMLCEGISEG